MGGFSSETKGIQHAKEQSEHAEDAAASRRMHWVPRAVCGFVIVSKDDTGCWNAPTR
jgi:hypothetical protein